MSIDSGVVRSHVAEDALADTRRVASVIDGSHVLVGRLADSAQSSSIRRGDHENIFLYKDYSSFNKDMQTLRLAQGGIEESASGLGKSLKENRVNITTTYMKLIIAYVVVDGDASVETSQGVTFTTKDTEYRDVIRGFQSELEQRAWTEEIRRIKDGEKVQWSDYQKKRILSIGRLDSYDVRNRWNVEKYPELACSVRNVQFVRKT